MAKPLSSASTVASTSSKYTCRRSQKTQEAFNHRWHRSSRQPLSVLAPSSGVLSLLASIVSASSAHGSPVPPPFLCPSIDSGHDEIYTLTKRASTSSSYLSDTHNVRVARHVPDRFRQEADGVWRRVDSYTLYGSTMPTCSSGSCSQPTAVPTSVDDQIKGADSQNDPTLPSTRNMLNLEDLPPGWKPTTKITKDRTSLILALSLGLAFFICFFIVGCLFWRKNITKLHRRKDVEGAKMKKKWRGREDEGREVAVEKEIKVKQKVWARATARWKANVRYSARQRRRVSRLSQGHQSSVSFDNSRTHLASSVSVSSSSSRRSSMVSIRNQPHSEEPSPTTLSAAPRPQTLSTLPPQTITLALPPAYQHHGQIPPIIVSSADTSTTTYSGFTTPAGTDRSRRPSLNGPSVMDDVQAVAPTTLLTGHVATDDKALLARLANLASAPPLDGYQDSEDLPGAPQVSVPTWHDEDIEDFGTSLVPPNNLTNGGSPSLSPMFPPPPSKERLAAAEFYDYTYSFDELETPDLGGEPSAPPFEEGSPPSLEVAPSAPPLLDDNDFLTESQPSAPQLGLRLPAEPTRRNHAWSVSRPATNRESNSTVAFISRNTAYSRQYCTAWLSTMTF